MCSFRSSLYNGSLVFPLLLQAQQTMGARAFILKFHETITFFMGYVK
jgi:hypothetical protein